MNQNDYLRGEKENGKKDYHERMGFRKIVERPMLIARKETEIPGVGIQYF